MLAFKYSDSALPNIVAFSIVLLGYPLTLLGLISGFIPWYLAVLLLAQLMILAAYLLHDCLHGSIFRLKKDNDRLGHVLSWIVGSSYSRLDDLREKHLRHHRERADVLGVDLDVWVKQSGWLKPVLTTLAFFHFPVKEVAGRSAVIALPFVNRQYANRRRHVIRVLLLRTTLLLILFLTSPIAWLNYCLACCLFMVVLSFMDFSQHDYALEYRLQEPARRPEQSAEFEETHTFSNLISHKFPALNGLVLNFCYHNAHHQKPGEPWYRLPKLHQHIYADHCAQTISLSRQLQRFHDYRLLRLQNADKAKEAGVDGVSFLVSV